MVRNYVTASGTIYTQIEGRNEDGEEGFYWARTKKDSQIGDYVKELLYISPELRKELLSRSRTAHKKGECITIEDSFDEARDEQFSGDLGFLLYVIEEKDTGEQLCLSSVVKERS